jgi:ABC-type Zn uptake system ZnuABC Zn-binding protein ZnuA
VWLDPVKMAAMAERVRDALIARRPDLSDPIRSSAAAIMRAYAALDSLCRVRLDPVRFVPFVAYHGGMNHLVARYGLSQVAVLEPFPGREPSPRYMKEVVLTVRRTGARVVFSEPQISARLAEVVGRESGIPVVEIDVLGGLPGRTTYDGLMRSMLDTLTGALARGAAR